MGTMVRACCTSSGYGIITSETASSPCSRQKTELNPIRRCWARCPSGEVLFVASANFRASSESQKGNTSPSSYCLRRKCRSIEVWVNWNTPLPQKPVTDQVAIVSLSGLARESPGGVGFQHSAVCHRPSSSPKIGSNIRRGPRCDKFGLLASS
jgi:hypothetical protein